MRLIAIIVVGLTAATAGADDDLVALLGGSGRVIATSTGYRTANATILRTSDGYRATTRDGRIVYFRRDATGWRASTYGEAAKSSTRTYFDSVER